MNSLVLLALFAAPTPEPLPASRTASFADWGVGSTFEYLDTTESPTWSETDRRVWVVTARDAQNVTITETLTRGKEAPRDLLLTLPLSAVVTFAAEGKGPVSTTAAPIETPIAWEDVTVPAGAYHCLHTHADTTQLESSGSSDAWWASDVPVAIKWIGRSSAGGVKGGTATTTRVLVKAMKAPLLPAARVVSWQGWGVGSRLVTDTIIKTWTNPKPSHETDTWTVTANDGAHVTVTMQIVQDGSAPRTYTYTYPESTTITFAPGSKGGPMAGDAPPPEAAVGRADVTVPAGTFHALEVTSSRDIIDASGKTTAWWADGIPLAVKQVSVTQAKGGETTATTTLTSILKK